MAESITERVDDPSEAGVDFYVGLEHLDPGSLKIRRWGAPEDVAATKLRFTPGDIIFGRRRAYQRKVAVAEFEGICSAHALVLRACEEIVDKEFLPFFMQSDEFFNRALSISVGSLSPTINWRALARQEFAVPPIAEQRRITEILKTADSTADAMRAGADHLDSLTAAYFVEVVERHKTSLKALGDLLAVCQYGLSTRAATSGAIPILGMANISNGTVDCNEVGFVDLSSAELKAYQLQKGDILFNRTNSFDLVGKAGRYELEGVHVFASYLLRLRVDEAKALSAYINAYLTSSRGQRQLRTFATRGVSQSNINASSLKRVQVPLPSKSEQQIVADTLAAYKEGSLRLRQNALLVSGLKNELSAKLLEATVSWPHV